MQFTCTQENMLKGLSSVTPIAGRNNQLPILQHVLLQAKDNVLNLTTTDLEIGVHTVVGGKMEKSGSCAIPARRFMEYIQQLPPTNPITVKKEDKKVAVATKGFNAHFSIADAEDFPLLPTTDKSKKISLDSPRFCEGLSRVIFAASREDTRPEIQSVFIQAQEKELRLVSTDTFRLAEEILKPRISEEFSLLVPLVSAGEIARLFSGQDTIDILPHENYVSFYGNGIELTSRLVDGSYPDYKQIIPSSWKTRVVLDKNGLIRALKTLNVFLPKDSKRVHMNIDIKKGEISLDVVGGDVGDGNVLLDMDGEGDDLSILFNVQYLLEGLQRIIGDEVEIKLGGSEEPVVFSPVKQKINYTYLVMPIQV